MTKVQNAARKMDKVASKIVEQAPKKPVKETSVDLIRKIRYAASRS